VATDGQVLVFDDLVGLATGKPAKFVKRYAETRAELVRAVESYRDDVRARQFPAAMHGYGIDAAELEELRSRLM
jgi:3-methyl-2-oxobutanoate hydroxymethyltransferase